MKLKHLLIIVVFASILQSCGLTENEKEFERITTTFKENEDQFRTIWLNQNDSLTEFSEDLLHLDYSSFLDKYKITPEDEPEFLNVIGVTAKIITAQNKLEERIKNLEGLNLE